MTLKTENRVALVHLWQTIQIMCAAIRELDPDEPAALDIQTLAGDRIVTTFEAMGVTIKRDEGGRNPFERLDTTAAVIVNVIPLKPGA